MFRSIAAGVGASAFVLAFSGPALADTLTGVVHAVEPAHITITLSSGSLKMMEVKKGVNATNVGKGDEVELALNDEDEVLGIKVLKSSQQGAKKD